MEVISCGTVIDLVLRLLLLGLLPDESRTANRHDVQLQRFLLHHHHHYPEMDMGPNLLDPI